MYMSYVSLILITIFYFIPVGLLLRLLNRRLKKSGVATPKRLGMVSSITVVLFLIPTWDAILGKHYLDYYCEKDGGLYDFHQERIDGLYIEYRADLHSAKQYLKRGFDFVEMGMQPDYVRFFIDANGELLEQPVAVLNSQVRRVYDDPNTRVGPDSLTLTVYNQYLEDLDTGEPVAGFRSYAFYTELDAYLGRIGATPVMRCTNIPRFQNDERFPKSESHYLDVVRSISAGGR